MGLGEVLFDLLPSGPRLGGAPANFAYTASRLGISAALVSAVGRDAMGKKARRLLEEKGLALFLAETDCPTGHVNVSFREGGIPSYTFAADPAYEAIPYTAELAELAGKADLCCFGTLAQYGPLTRETARRFLQEMRPESRRVFDVNLRGHFYSREGIEDLLDLAGAVKCNEEELPLLCGFAGLGDASPEAYRAYLAARGISCFIYTEGAKGSTVFLEGERSFLAAPKEHAADTVGAGDSFTAAFFAGLLQGLSLRQAHALAAYVSAYVCTREGGMPDFPKDAPCWAKEIQRKEEWL